VIGICAKKAYQFTVMIVLLEPNESSKIY